MIVIVYITGVIIGLILSGMFLYDNKGNINEENLTCGIVGAALWPFVFCAFIVIVIPILIGKEIRDVFLNNH